MNSKREKRERIMGYCFILPAVVYMLIFIGYPIIYNWIISFQDVTATTLGSSARDFLGFDNYRAVFGDPTFPRAVKQTFFLYHILPDFSICTGLSIRHVLQ